MRDYNPGHHYRTYFETLLMYGSDAAATHQTNAFLYLDDGDLLPFDPRAADAKIKFSSRDGTR